MWNAMKGLLFAGVMLALATLSAQAQTPLAAGATWTNELGSVLVINSVASNGLMTGTYTTKVGCDAGKPQPMTGWFYAGPKGGGAITFSVYWAGCDSVTSWTGQYDTSTGNFKALWYLALAAPPTWNGIVAGSDTFVRTFSKNGMKK